LAGTGHTSRPVPVLFLAISAGKGYTVFIYFAQEEAAAMAEKKNAGFTGVILAGGRSSRMGRDKAGLLWEGRTFLRLQAEKLRSLGARELLVSGAGLSLPDARTVPDLYPDRGPLGGLHACLKGASCPRVLVLAVDLPLVSEEILRDLLALHARSGAQVAALADDGRLQPLAAVYDAALADAVEGLIRDGPRPVRALLETCRTVSLPCPPGLLLNCNTQADYDRLCQGRR